MPIMDSIEIATELVMSRMSDRYMTLVMIEGKTDRALWTEYASSENCRLFPTHGKRTVVDALNAQVLRGLSGIVGIVDLDYWLICGAEELRTENLLYDDAYPDMELVVLSSPALQKVLRNALYNFEVEEIHAFAKRLRQEALRLSIDYGYFRLANHISDHGLNFKALFLEDFIDEDLLLLDRDWLARRLTENQTWLSSDELLSEVEYLQEEYPPDNVQLCNGHDVITVIACILPALFHSEFGTDLPTRTEAALFDEVLSASLRSAYEFEYFIQSSLYGNVRKWESENTPFRVFRDFPVETN